MPLAAKDKKKVRPEDRQVDMDSPTFVPMVRVGKVLDTNGSGDSIQSVELNNVYVFGPMSDRCFFVSGSMINPRESVGGRFREEISEAPERGV